MIFALKNTFRYISDYYFLLFSSAYIALRSPFQETYLRNTGHSFVPFMRAFSVSVPSKVWLNADDPSDAYRLYCRVPIPPKKRGGMRVWVDGCFDMMHFGHANVLRQALQLGAKLQKSAADCQPSCEDLERQESDVEVLVGCHSDAEIIKVKGPPIMLEEERYDALCACKWTTYVIENAPYNTRLKDIDRFEVDFVVHGDDMSLDENGKNSYQEIIDAGRMKIVKRTESISSTELVGRMLLCTRAHQLSSVEKALEEEMLGSFHRKNFLTTNRKILQFSNNSAPKPGDKIVYVDGGFDLLHVGHINVLRQARALGDYLIVGLYEDSVVNALRGCNFPIMNMNERMLGLLSCRYVDEVVLGVDPVVSETLLDTFHISLVIKGSLDIDTKEVLEEYYRVPRERNILVQVESGNSLTTDSVIQRVVDNRVAYIKRQAEKRKKDKPTDTPKPAMYANAKEL